jgi:diguanylate cyclase (GGDEF)-like protein
MPTATCEHRGNEAPRTRNQRSTNGSGQPNAAVRPLQPRARPGQALRARSRFLFCDVDAFKSINDRCGHDAGGRLLCEIADQLRGAVRDVDTVARIAGDEFVVICPGLAVAAALQVVRERWLASVDRIGPMPDGSSAPRLTVGAVLAERGQLAAGMTNRDDAAMHRAKIVA